MKYHNCKPIRSREHTVWIIELPTGERRIAIWSKDADIRNVHHFYAIRYTEFKIGQLGVGEHVIAKTDHSYMDDARFINQDWDVGLEDRIPF